MQNNKTVIYIDAANLILTARDFNLQYDVYSLLVFLKDKFKQTNFESSCIYFTGKVPGLEVDYEYLKNLGAKIVFKDIYSENGKNKANCDVEISNRITTDVKDGLVDNLILLTGDGDFSSLLDWVKSKVIFVEVFAITPKRTSFLLKKKKYLKIVYLSDIISKVQKQKGPAIHEKIEGTLFNNSSITNPQGLSSAGSTNINI